MSDPDSTTDPVPLSRPAARCLDMIQDLVKKGRTPPQAAAELKSDFAEMDLDGAIDEALADFQRQIERTKYLTEVPAVQKTHIDWYGGPQESDVFWPALKRYLVHEKGWDDMTVQSIDEASSKVVSHLHFPHLPTYSTRGLVLGYVQSGKTANFTSVVSKAADAGFKFFIVLSGLTNSLRRQTQIRLDQELIGLNTDRWVPLTTEQSDFNGQLPNLSAMLNTAQPHLAVVKKNKSRLEKLIRMIRETSLSVLRQTPVLVIDDECDQASVDGSGNPDPEVTTTINRLVRELLDALPKVSYVGYTATPYANVLINPAYADDLYPSDFILALPRPSSYFGAERIFGRDILETDPDHVDFDGLDLIRYIPDEEIESLRPANASTREDFEFKVTGSMRRAVLYFLLASAARTARGDGEEHLTMLVHTSQYVQTHRDAKAPLDDLLCEVRSGLDEGDQALLREMKDLWESEQDRVPADPLGCPTNAFAELELHLAACARDVSVVVENSQSDERLDYNGGGSRQIVVGGNVLARGLTLEGLVVSFFLRTSRQYDTLMQMGRWFGYRRGYEDLPRVWMTSGMAEFFKDMATVEAEMREDVKVYGRRGITPAQFALRIRKHPALSVTGRNKMTHANTVDLSYSGRRPQTTKFLIQDAAWLEGNWNAGAALVDAASASGPAEEHENGSLVYRRVPVKHVLEFLRTYSFHESHVDLRAGELEKYVKRQAEKDRLRTWSIVVVGRPTADLTERPLGAAGVRRGVARSRLKALLDDGAADIKALMSTSDVLLDLDGDMKASSWEAAHDLREQAGADPLLLLYPIPRSSSPSEAHKKTRAPLGARGDVLGLGFAFPRSEADKALAYVSVGVGRSIDNTAASEED